MLEHYPFQTKQNMRSIYDNKRIPPIQIIHPDVQSDNDGTPEMRGIALVALVIGRLRAALAVDQFEGRTEGETPIAPEQGDEPTQ